MTCEPTEDNHILHILVILKDKIRVSISRKYRKSILSGIARDLPICTIMRKKIKQQETHCTRKHLFTYRRSDVKSHVTLQGEPKVAPHLP
jgi:hypothetical protein